MLSFRRRSLFGKKGKRLLIPHDLVIYRKFTKLGHWSLPDSIFLAKGLKKNCNTIVDLGAHAGLVSLQALRIAGKSNTRVIAVEPIPAHVECLNFNFKDENLTLHNGGFVSGNEKELKIFLDSGNLGNSSALPSILSNALNSEEFVIAPAINILDVMESVGVSNFVMKSDLQGLDLHVLSSIPINFWKQVKRGVIEVNAHENISQNECTYLMDQISELFKMSWSPFPFAEIPRKSVEEFWTGKSLEERDIYLISRK
jgi:FkbM family methyltransferase